MSFKLAIFASGAGSNFKTMLSNQLLKGRIAVLVVNRDCGAEHIAKEYNIPVLKLSNSDFNEGDFLIDQLRLFNINGVVLAGFLRKIPIKLIEHFQETILNIHPALLPKYGGKGMYGAHVHTAVFNNKEQFSGITIHKVTANFDEGATVFQAETDISACKNPLEVAARVQELEHAYFSNVVFHFFNDRFNKQE